MALNARNLLNDDTTDIGYDIVLDNVASLSGDVGITKIILGAAGADGGLVSATNPIPTQISDGTDTALVSAAGSLAVNLAEDALDLMTGTDFSGVFGTATLLTSTQADNLANTTDTINTSSFLYGFDGSTWDRVAVGGGTQAAALRVTVATDSTGVVSVDDNGASLTVDGTVTANAGTGDFLTSIGHTRDEVFKEAATIGGELDDAATVTATEGTVSPARITAQRALHANLRNNSGTEIGTTANPVGVRISDGTDTALVSAAGSVAVNLAEDALDLMTGTDFSNVLGTATLVTTTQADNLVNTTDTINASALGYVFDGATWDRMRGDSTDGVLVNLGTNNDITGTVTANAGTNLNTSALALDATLGSVQTAVELIDDTVHSGDAALSKYMVLGAVYDDVATATVTENQAQSLRMTSGRALHVSHQGTVTVTDDGSFTLAANSGVDIGDVTLNNGFASVTGSGTEAGALRVTIASDSTGVITVDNAGTFATQVDGAALTALQLVDDIVFVDDADWTALTSKHALVGGVYQASPGSITDGDTGPLRLTVNGAVHASVQNTVTVSATALDIRSLTNTDVVTAELSATDNAVLDDIAARTSDPTVFTDDAAYTVATDKGTVAMGVNTTDTVDAGDAGALSIDANRHLQVDIAADSVGIGGGTQYTEDDAAAANPVGNAVMLVRDDVPGTLVTTDGDNVAQRGTNYGAAFCQIVNSTGSFVDSFGGGTQYTEGNTDASITGTAMMFEGAADTLVAATGDATNGLDVDVTRVQGSVAVTNAGTFAVQESGVALTALQLIDDSIFADDAAFTLGSSKTTVSGAIRDDSLSALAAIEGDVVPLRVSSTGALHVTGGGGGTEYTDDTSTHATGASVGGLMMAAAVPTDGTVDANDIGAVAMSLDRRLLTDSQIVGQDAALDVSAATVTVDLGANNDVTVTSGTITTVTNLAQMGGQALAMGTGVKTAGTQRVTVATDDIVPVSQSGTWNITNVSGTVSLPTGAATAANQLADNHQVTANAGTGDFLTVVGHTVNEALKEAAAIGGQLDDTGTTAATENNIAPVRITAQRAIHANLRDASGVELTSGGGVEANALRVTLASDSTGQVTVDGTVNIGTFPDNEPFNIAQIAGTAASVNTGVVDAGTQRVTLATDVALPAGTNAIGRLAANSGVDIGDVDILSLPNEGQQSMANSISVAVASDQSDINVSLSPKTSGGLSFYKTIDLDETEEEVKATAGQIYGIIAINLANAVRYLKIYNATAATVVVGTTVPDMTIPLPTQGDTNGAGFVWQIPHGIVMGTAMTIAATTGVADNDAGAPGANEVVLTLLYK